MIAFSSRPAARPSLTARAMLASLMLAPLVTACGALPAAEVLPTPVPDPPTADHPPPLARAAEDAPPPAAGRAAFDGRKTKRARPAVAPALAAPAVTAPARRISATAPPAVGGARHLARLHPEVRRMARALFEQAAAEGIELKFISGYRAFDRHSKKARAGRASWHAFGMAFDVNLAHRVDMRDALAHYDREAAQWERVGAIAERLGLTWGVQWGRHEVFHFEWHPGMPEAIRRPTLTALLSDAGPDGAAIEKVWRRFPVAADGAAEGAPGVAARDGR